ncbi:MAG: hypothetical protein HY040_08160, partial [Planctomycetes bacterium]|nr:hypothetical protein [Planctomycetota bacterium]
EYDHQGRRIRKQFYTYNSGWVEQSDLIFLYDGWNLVAELDANAGNGRLRTYVWGNDLSGTMQGAGGVGGLLKVTDYTSGTTNHFVAYDGNGNVAALTDTTSGALTARYEYGPFAEPLRSTGWLGRKNPIRFSTKYHDDETALVYYGYRYYSSSMGRWLSRDPINEPGFGSLRDHYEPSAWTEGKNLYLALKNDPTDTYDLYGLLATGPACRILTVAAPTVAAGIATLPATAIVLAVVIVSEGVLITYEICDAGCRRCPPCKPYAAGTHAYETHRVPPLGDSTPHYPWPGDHIHWWVVNQNPNTCKCYWNRDKRAGQPWIDAQGVRHRDDTAPIVPNGANPPVPPGTPQVPPLPILTP